MRSVNKISRDSSNTGQERTLILRAKQGLRYLRWPAQCLSPGPPSHLYPLLSTWRSVLEPSEQYGWEITYRERTLLQTNATSTRRASSAQADVSSSCPRGISKSNNNTYDSRCIYFPLAALGLSQLSLSKREFTQDGSCKQEQTAAVDLLTLQMSCREPMHVGTKQKQTVKPAVVPCSKQPAGSSNIAEFKQVKCYRFWQIYFFQYSYIMAEDPRQWNQILESYRHILTEPILQESLLKPSF